jgi:ZIP family zinc transporter
MVDVVVKYLTGDHHHHHHDLPHGSSPDSQNNGDAQKSKSEAREDISVRSEEFVVPHCVGCSDDPVGELKEWHEMADREEAKAKQDGTILHSADASSDSSSPDIFSENEHDTRQEGEADTGVAVYAIDEMVDEMELRKSLHDKKLVRMGINTALAIGLHNFPEGLATFVAALNDPKVGAVLAVAIGIHNIPEGLCVALPIYYATGNRKKAFLWALLSGASEPLAALLGWAVLANSFSDDLYAVLFGFVGGMMVIISVKELLPTAHRYDPDDTVITYSFIVGMFIMALSLVLFVI